MSPSHHTPYYNDNSRREPQTSPVIHQNRPRRRWPPYPMVEDEAISLSREYKPLLPDKEESETRFRGEIDQFPMMVEVDPPVQNTTIPSAVDRSSRDREIHKSDSSSGSPVPTDSNDSNSDQRFVYMLEKGVGIPSTYDDPRTPKQEKKPRFTDDRGRMKQDVPRPEIEQSNPKSPEEQSPHLKREPSPYAYGPKQPISREFYSGEHLLPSDVMSPKIGHGKPQTTYVDNAAQPARQYERNPSVPVIGGPPRPRRPSVNTHTSAIGHLSQHPIRSGNEAPLQSAPYPVSSDESDLSDDESQNSPLSPRRFSMPRPENFSPRKESHFSSLKQPNLIAFDNRVPQVLGANILQPSPRHEVQASHRGSPVANSPSSPPITPPDDRNFRKITHPASPQNTPPNSRPTSRPSSPVQASGLSQPGSIPNSPNQSKNNIGFTNCPSPLPSPGIEGASYISPPHINVREPSPAGHKKSTSYDAAKIQQSASGHASLLPSALPNPPMLQAPPLGGRRRTLSNLETRPNPSVNPPLFQQTSKTFQSPRARSRPTTPNRAVSFESQAITLSPCPRSEPVAGYNDWYNLADCPSFAICPSCRHAVFSSGYEQYFVPRPPKPSEVKTRCGFGSQWLRIAWLLTIQNRRTDANLIYAMARIATSEPSCPGKTPTVGKWFRVADVESGKQISDFDVCSSCVRNLETIFPTLQGVFQKSQSRHPERKRPCDLRCDSKRFPGYIDLLESIAKQSREFRRQPNLLAFTKLAKEMADIRECSRDDMLFDQQWHTMPQIPEFTVCEDCYLEVIRPAKKNGSALASNFSHNPEFVAGPKVANSCQLYSPRIRIIFADACKRNDLAGLRSLAVQRYRVERDLQGKIAELCRLDLGGEERAERIKQLVEEWKKWE